MKTKLTEAKFKSALERIGQSFRRVACFGAVILMCSSASAQNLFVSGFQIYGYCNENCGAIFEFTWDGNQSIFDYALHPGDLAFDSASHLFLVDSLDFGDHGFIAEYNLDGTGTLFASGLSYPLYLATDKTGNVFVAEYNTGIIYQYKPTGSRGAFASGLYHPTGIACDSAGNLFVVDNSVGNIDQGSIYEYKPNGSRTTFAVLGPSDRPADLAFDSMGNLFMADLGGTIYKFTQQRVRTTFGSVPNSAQSLAFDSAGNLFVVDAGDANGNGNAIYKFTPQGVRSTFATGVPYREGFLHVAFQPMPTICCQ